MKYDIIVAGVGGQGILSISAIIASAAVKDGLQAQQSEVHGMAQRGGAVYTHLRIADAPIHSGLIAEGTADLILGMEPVEALRYTAHLAPTGTLLTSQDPVVNVPDYPDMDTVLDRIRLMADGHVVEAGELARTAGSPKAANMVMVGAAARFLPIKHESLQFFIINMFRQKGQQVIETNLNAFQAGVDAVRCVPQ
jgi:indolepyruvate ferredoxin oxidoreductase beta subunit